MNERKEVILNILCRSFEDNPSVNFVIKQDNKKEKHIRLLMEYCYYNCNRYGKVYLNKEQTCCALVIEPLKKKTNLRSIVWDIRLALDCIGLKNMGKVLKRETAIKTQHPKEPYIHFWYLGVLPEKQGKGLGTQMIHTLLNDAKSENKSAYFETSNPKNFPLYDRLGFTHFDTLSVLGYDLRLYKMEWINRM